MESALWGLLFTLTHLLSLVVGVVLGGAGVVVAIHGIRLFPVKVPPRPLPQAMNHAVRAPSEQEKAAAFEGQWVNPAFTVDDFRDMPIRGPLKRVNPTGRSAGSSGAFQVPIKDRVVGQPESRGEDSRRAGAGPG